MFETFDHTADLGLRIAAATREELFSEAARGLTAQIVENSEAIEPRETVVIEKSGDAVDYLLFDWLDELLYQYECKQLLFREFRIELSDHSLRAECLGEPVDPSRHRLAHEVKAITYHDFIVEPTPDGWRAEFIVDI